MRVIKSLKCPSLFLVFVCVAVLLMGLTTPFTAFAFDTCVVKFGTTSSITMLKGDRLSQNQIPALKDKEFTFADGIAKGYTATAHFCGWLPPSEAESVKADKDADVVVLDETVYELVISGSAKYSQYGSQTISHDTYVNEDMDALALYVVYGNNDSEIFISKAAASSANQSFDAEPIRKGLGFLPDGFSVTEEVLAPVLAEAQAKYGSGWKPSGSWSLFTTRNGVTESTSNFKFPYIVRDSSHAELYTSFVVGNTPNDDVSPDIAISGNMMYRLYNPNSGEHFYTALTSERDSIEASGWNYEGIAWTAPIASSAPVYRLYSGTDHHYTTSENEKDDLVKVGWTYEGIGWYSDDAQGVGLHRLYNPYVDPTAPTNNSGSHHYTIDTAEKDSLVSTGWLYEDYGWYGVK